VKASFAPIADDDAYGVSGGRATASDRTNHAAVSIVMALGSAAYGSDGYRLDDYCNKEE
jgi:hypothetical protein